MESDQSAGGPSRRIGQTAPAQSESSRTVLFIVIQVLFLAVSPLTGGFHYKIWSMLDSALLLSAIGVTALVLVLDASRGRSLALKTGIMLYVLGVVDMSVNVLISGWIGWGRGVAPPM